MRQKWAVLAVIALLLALCGNQVVAMKLKAAISMNETPDGGVGLAGAADRMVTLETANSTTPPADLPRVLEHSVVAGETLVGIAARYGTDKTTLQAINRLSGELSLRAGQKLQVLTTVGVLHKITSGDTLWDIARSYKVTVASIQTANPQLSISALKLGQQLIIPGAKPAPLRQLVVSRGTSSGTARATASTGLGFRWPLSGRITSGFGRRWGKLHAALDIGVATGTTVRAAASGRVIYAGWASGYGYLVKVAHSGGYETRYGHNSRVLVKVGQQVQRGQAVARSGNTGFSTGPHLHFEVIKGGKSINPLTVLP